MAILALGAWWRSAGSIATIELTSAAVLAALAIAVYALRFRIGNMQDYVGGLMLVAMALFAFWASRDLPGMRGFAFGPGTSVRLFSGLLLGLGVILTVTGMFTQGPGIDRVTVRGSAYGLLLVVIFVLLSRYTTPIIAAMGYRQGETVIAAIVVLLAALGLSRAGGLERGPMFVTASILMFAGTIRPLGLIIASFCSILVASAATFEVRWRETLIWAAALTAFCAFLFPYALNLPFNFWPRF
jgi:putative tricarboxylic transport membrane protein